MELVRRLRYLLLRHRLERELAQDMEVHREMAGERAGFGSTLRLREEAREVWGWMWIDRLSQDLRFGARLLRRSPVFTIVAILMLTVGIGVNIAAFGFFNLMVLRSLPVRDPGSLLRFQRRAPENFSDNLPYPAVTFYREHATTTLSSVMAIRFAGLSLDDEAPAIKAHFVTTDYFSELSEPGASPILGRVLDPIRDEAADAESVAVLDRGFWQRRFGSDPAIVGKTIRLNGTPVSIVGVASPNFSGLTLGNPDVWLPIGQEPRLVAGSRLMTDFSGNTSAVFMWGRLRPGLTPAVAESELRTLAQTLHRLHPRDIWDHEELPSEPGGYPLRLIPPMYPVLALVIALCSLILIVTCSSLASLLIARGAARQREIATRVAIGAGRGRLIRQLLTESLLLASIGGAFAMAVGYVVLRGLMTWADAPPWISPLPDWRVIAFAIGMGVAAALVFGLTPALQVARQRTRVGLLRRGLIGGQVAASAVLLIVAALLVRALDTATTTKPGFDYEHVMTIDLRLGAATPAAARAHLDALTSRLRGLPGVVSVSMATNPPLGNRWTVFNTTINGRAVNVHVNGIDPAFFETMTIPLLQGRTPRAGEPHAIVISDSLARLQWPGEDPLGKPFRARPGEAEADIVVGVAGSARLVSPEDSDAVEVYRLASPESLPAVVVLVKTAVPAESLIAQAAAVAKAINPRVFPDVQPLAHAFRGKLQTSAVAAASVSLLGLVALWLACAGIVGLVIYGVSQRTKEIGIRIALGAQPRQVLTVVLREFAWPLILGLVSGVAIAILLSRVLRQELYGISNLDPLAYAAAIAIFAIAAATAALIPATRALRIPPLNALRQD